jgi:hypothetical protein
MAIAVKRVQSLTPEECEACGAYYADATFWHAMAQGWSVNDLRLSPELFPKIGILSKHLDKAVQKFQLFAAGVVFSGHGRGISVVGSLGGPPDKFVGLKYCYPGYTSASSDRGTAENFLRTRAAGARTPILLEFRLKNGQAILPMDNATGQCGEGEYLLPRHLEFEISAAALVRIEGVTRDVLHLVLR